MQVTNLAVEIFQNTRTVPINQYLTDILRNMSAATPDIAQQVFSIFIFVDVYLSVCVWLCIL